MFDDHDRHDREAGEDGSRPVSRRDRARVELIVTAERLLATHGLENVSFRQIASEAGYANPATIQYHFGSREALFCAIIDHRLPDIDRRRMELLDGTSATISLVSLKRWLGLSSSFPRRRITPGSWAAWWQPSTSTPAPTTQP